VKLLIRIRDDVWNLYKRSCALFDIKGYGAVVRNLEEEMLHMSRGCLEDGKRQLLSDCPEAYMHREIGIREEQNKLTKTARKPTVAESSLNKISATELRICLPYSEVIVDPASPYCDCREKECAEYSISEFGSHYCRKHNVIVMENPFLPKNPEDVFQITIQIISHETLHWLVGKIFGESASFVFDNSLVFDFIEKW